MDYGLFFLAATLLWALGEVILFAFPKSHKVLKIEDFGNFFAWNVLFYIGAGILTLVMSAFFSVMLKHWEITKVFFGTVLGIAAIIGFKYLLYRFVYLPTRDNDFDPKYDVPFVQALPEPEPVSVEQPVEEPQKKPRGRPPKNQKD